MEKNFVIFYSPGTIVAETTQKPIDSWDVDTALKMLKDIKERHQATPYGFRFTTRGRSEDELDSKEIASSGMYFINGREITLEELKSKNDPKDEILISNMKCNGYDKVFQTTKGWRWTQPINEGDVVLEAA